MTLLLLRSAFIPCTDAYVTTGAVLAGSIASYESAKSSSTYDWPVTVAFACWFGALGGALTGPYFLIPYACGKLGRAARV